MNKLLKVLLIIISVIVVISGMMFAVSWKVTSH